MNDLGSSALMLAGLLITAVGGIWFTVLTFKKGIAWGVGNLLLPLVGLVFIAKYWNECWRPTAISALGIATIWLGATFYLQTHPQMTEDPFSTAIQKGKLP